MSTIINISDLIPIRHGDAKLSVGWRKAKLGYRGYVGVSFPKTPTANYTVSCEAGGCTHETDATADAIALRKDIIAQNRITTP